MQRSIDKTAWIADNDYRGGRIFAGIMVGAIEIIRGGHCARHPAIRPPLFLSPVAAVFPPPADDFPEQSLDSTSI